VGRRLEGIPGFGIDRVAEAAGTDPEVLRLENLDTDVAPHPDVVEVTRAADGRDEADSYLPSSGLDEMKLAVASLIRRRGGPEYDPFGEIVITQGEGRTTAVERSVAVRSSPPNHDHADAAAPAD
jgi:aspartate/methionine/tyrosine aminotransferase